MTRPFGENIRLSRCGQVDLRNRVDLDLTPLDHALARKRAITTAEGRWRRTVGVAGVASHAPPATGRKNANLKETSWMSIVASVIAPTAPVAASVPRAPVARFWRVPLPSQKSRRGPAHRGLVVARGGEISWDEG